MDVDSTDTPTENADVLPTQNALTDSSERMVIDSVKNNSEKLETVEDGVPSNAVCLNAVNSTSAGSLENENEIRHEETRTSDVDQSLRVNQEPVPNVIAETHLESNLNVIENQNNENLERDSELIGGSDEANIPIINEANICHGEDRNCEDKSRNDLEEISHKTSEKSQLDELETDVIESEASGSPNHNNKSDTEYTVSENVKSPENVKTGSTDVETQSTMLSQELDETSSPGKTQEPIDIQSSSEKDNEENDSSFLIEEQSDPIELPNVDYNIESQPRRSAKETCENLKKPSSDSDKEIDGRQPPGEPPPIEDVVLSKDGTSETMEIGYSRIEKEGTSALGEVDTGSYAASDISETVLSTYEKSQEHSKDSDSDEDKADSNKSRSETESPTKCTDINEKSIEFAHVNFDSADHEKDTESDKDTIGNKETDLDPIGSDSVDPADEQEGANEELTIIPDTEREFTQAEKDAACSIPPLKDISDTTSESSIQEPDSSYELKVYKYDKEEFQNCNECKMKRKVKYHYKSDDEVLYICDNSCLSVFKECSSKKIDVITDEGGIRVKNFIDSSAKEPPSLSFIRKCATCKKVTDDIEKNLTWEIMDFCNEFCLSKYQKMIGSNCASCSGTVKATSLGKYCVRFGNDIRQFCTSTCLEQYKKGLKVCSYCQQDMSSGPDGFLAPVGEKGQFKDFCSKTCMEKYDIMTNDRPPKVDPGTICSVCKTEKVITIEFEQDDVKNYFCGEPCFVAFNFVNKISPGKCAMCRRYFHKSILEQHTMYYDNVQYSFCSNSCENIYIIAHRKIVPCSWCKVKKYNFDMIKKYSSNSSVINMCSINCLSLYKVSLSAVSTKPITCNFCQKNAHPAYHLTMSDATVRNFCSYSCVMSFQNQFMKQPVSMNNVTDAEVPVPAGAPQKNKKSPTENASGDEPPLPVISSVQSLASANGTGNNLPPGLTPIGSTRITRSKATPLVQQSVQTSPTAPVPVQNLSEIPIQVQVKQHFIVRPPPCPEQRNVGTMVSIKKTARAVQSNPVMVDAGIQTDREEISKIVIPIPVPIYVPAPCHMYSTPVPIPVPFPLPIPIPIFIPTTRNSAAGIMKEIKKIQVKIPTDPYEAELLMMAEMVAEEKKEDNTDSESDLEDNTADGADYSPEPVDASNTFGDDMLQMALKMATELDEPAVDLEGALTANTITAPQGAHQDGTEENVDDPQPMHHHLMERSPLRGRKRGIRGNPRGQSKRGRRMSHHQVDIPMMQQVQQPPPPPEPQEKPDANMCLKYTFGVNAWKQWVTTKNAELEKSSRRMKLFKTEILQLTADELNYSLCLFVKEVRKPNGQEYAPDTIYYLCLGIQQYLFENGRIDNIFCDPYYEKFTDCLDEVAKKFSVLYNDSHYIVTRVEEEHLWESKQLGAHSPHVLLSTLMFFNTKHFNLTSVDEHMQLSFSHIMKHWKRNPNQPGASKVPGSRNVLLRFYPPQSATQNNQRKKKVYEQQENEENPLRCPVKLYEFYLSKCPESVKTRNDVFYLQPERSCVPDSPVWYSTMPLAKEALEKMLHRVKMVKEINVALLTS
ncbi:zinc finger MYM-type protein 2 isoform X2 [Cylas formicarius]|uniref:zinc finger MYM-type protein 2 isoform X2 n=1 Tax=Cylas formicarius TaxID=197179 RepID=UPI0029587FCD|nr:zinc finger MYM-type protein 2 isoform X2 [Cylas formicarius]